MPRTIQADGRTIVVPDDATDDEINQLVGPAPVAATAKTPVPKQGLISSALDSSGLSTVGHAIMHPLTTAGNILQPMNPFATDEDLAKNPIMGAIGSMVKGSVDSASKGFQDAKDGKGIDSYRDFVESIPIAGPILGKTRSQYESGNNAGAAGTLLGAIGAAAAPELGGDALDAIPTKAKAGALFKSLNDDLATTPVTLKSAVDPLQRVTEIGARGSTLPKAVSDLLTRSQSPIDMTFPEARDYQSSLSDLSQSDKMAMNGRMSGGVSQLNKGLFTDIQDAANTAGRGDDYAKAMTDYRRASQINNGLKTAGKAAIGTAIGGTLLHKFLKPLLP